MSNRWFAALWVLAGLALIALIAATLALADRAKVRAVVGQPAYLTSDNMTVNLHVRPGTSSPVVAVLVRGSQVFVHQATRTGGDTWYLVQKGTMTPGWVPSRHVQLKPP